MSPKSNSERIAGIDFEIERRIVIEAEPVDRPADAREVARALAGEHRLRESVRITPEQLRIGKRIVPVGGEGACCFGVLGQGARGKAGLAVVNDAERRLRHVGAQHVDCRAMGKIDVVHRAQQQRAIADAGGLAAHAVTEQREDRGLVESREALHPVAVAAREQGGVIGEPQRGVAVGPAAEVVERLR